MKKLWPLWASIMLPLLLIALNSTPIAADFVFVLVAIPILTGVWMCLAIWALILAVLRIRKRQWPLAVVSVVLPLVMLSVGLRYLPFIHLCNDGGDIVYFMFERTSYLEQIRTLPVDGKPRIVIFNRGGMSWASRGYVYDESDEVMRAETSQSANWKAQANNTELACGYYAQPLPGHFSFTQHWYLASFNC